MKRTLTYVIIALFTLFAGSAIADEAANTEAQKTIQSQIEAFRAGDDARAYSYAAPTIQSFFPTVESFMAMVKGGYSPVWQPQHFQFGKSKEVGEGQVAQEVEIIAKDGSAWVALYSLMRMADGSWKITGVQLLKGDGGSA
jgi:ABC-type transporter MlaC component